VAQGADIFTDPGAHPEQPVLPDAVTFRMLVEELR
jgi:hypothetical protein